MKCTLVRHAIVCIHSTLHYLTSTEFFRTGFNYVIGPMYDIAMLNWVERYWKVANDVILV